VKESSFKKNNNNTNEHAILFGIGCLFGFLCFVSIYGFRVLNVTYDSWLMNGDMDLSQHYNGWLHFRMDPWHFPIGLIDSLSKPISVSVLYTDSIPLLAIFFKLFRNVLPVNFQYFGLYGLICFMLQGGLAAILIRRFCKEKWICILGSFLFILSFPLLQRMFYHTALSSQWIILLALNLWFYLEDISLIKKCIIYGLLGVLCVFIHSYYLPMAGSILLASIIDKALKSRALSIKMANTLTNDIDEEKIINNKTAEKQKKENKKNDCINKNCKIKKNIWDGIIQIAVFCLAALISLYCLGGFYGESAGIGEGIGSFTSNLNTFFNSLDMGAFGLTFPLYYEFQYEGSAYLGMGFVMLLILCFCLWVSSIIMIFACEERDNKDKSNIEILKDYINNHPTKTVLILLFIVMCLAAILPMVAANDKKLFGLPLPSLIKKIWNIFRSNGRFIWVPMYILILSMMVYINRHAIEKVAMVLLLVVSLLQIMDISKIAVEKHMYFAKEQVFESIYDEELADFVGGKDSFVFMYNENDIIMDTARFAYYNNMSLSNFYYARDIDEQIEEEISKWSGELNNNIIRDNIVYIFKKDDYKAGQYQGVSEIEKENHIFMVKD